MGIEAPLQSVPAEAIGGSPTASRRSNMADGYATLANGGVHHDPTAISKVEFPDGKVDETRKRRRRTRAHPGPGLRRHQHPQRRDHQGHRRRLHQPRLHARSAGKTGTSEEESDAWFVGYTPKFSTAVWVGHPQSREYDRLRRPDRRPDLAATTWKPATAGECPAFETPTSLPELSRLTGGHTAAGGYSLGPRRRRRRRIGEEEGEEGEEEEGAEEETEEEAPVEEAPEEVTHAPAARRRQSARASVQAEVELGGYSLAPRCTGREPGLGAGARGKGTRPFRRRPGQAEAASEMAETRRRRGCGRASGLASSYGGSAAA